LSHGVGLLLLTFHNAPFNPIEFADWFSPVLPPKETPNALSELTRRLSIIAHWLALPFMPTLRFDAPFEEQTI
jgi:hypothetical protein